MYKRAIIILFVILLFIWIGFALIKQSINQSLTSDEIVHLPAGYTYITTWDYRINPEHPILTKAWSALPWAIFKTKEIPDPYLWESSNTFYYDNWVSDRLLGQKLIFKNNISPEFKIISGRIMMSILTLSFIGLFTFYIWKKFGQRAGIFALILSAFNPIFLGYGHMVITDIAIAGCSFLAIALFINFIEKHSLKTSIFWGLGFGLAALTKYTIIIFAVFFAIAFIVLKYKYLKQLKWKYFFIGILTAYLLILLAYLPGKNIIAPEITQIDLEKWQNFNLSSDYLEIFNSWWRFLLIPAYYFKGMIHVLVHAESGHTAFLLGQTSKVGWWYYFPVAFFLKNSIFFLAILLMLFANKKYWNKIDLEQRIFWAAAGFYFLIALNSKANLGIRHLMPIFPILIYLMSASFIKITNNKKLYLIYLLTTLYCLTIFRVYPNFITFYSEVIGSPSNGYRYLVDSNIDWGQDLKYIARWQNDNKIDTIFLEYFWTGNEAIEYYGIKYRAIDPKNINENGYFIIGVSALQTNPFLAKFKDSKPYEIINNSVFVFKQ